MPAGDITAVVAGNAVSVTPVNTNFQNLQATLQALPVANLKNNRASFVVANHYAAAASFTSGTTYYIVFQNDIGVDGLRLTRLYAQARLAGAGDSIALVAEKASDAAFTAPTTMASFTLSTADSVGVSAAHFYEAAAPAANVERLPDTYWFRIKWTPTVGTAISDITLMAKFDHVLKPKA